MIKAFVPKLHKEGFGGGNSFVANMMRNSSEFVLTDDISEADMMFVANPMWAEREDFENAKERGLKIVIRLDNIPEDWNNRGTAISKLKDFIAASDFLVYQSKWAKEKYEEFITCNTIETEAKSMVIYNGVDTDLFTPDGAQIRDDSNSYPRILFIKSSRNENKRYPEAMEIYRRYWFHHRNAKLYLVGQFADDYHKYNFGFYNGERFEYLGIQPFEVMPTIYRSTDIMLFPAYADCSPNVVAEAMSCGLSVMIHPYGGGYEFLPNPKYTGSGALNRHIGMLGTTLYGYEEYDPITAIKHTLTIDREQIRNHMVDNFNVKDSITKYAEVFNGLI